MVVVGQANVHIDVSQRLRGRWIQERPFKKGLPDKQISDRSISTFGLRVGLISLQLIHNSIFPLIFKGFFII